VFRSTYLPSGRDRPCTLIMGMHIIMCVVGRWWIARDGCVNPFSCGGLIQKQHLKENNFASATGGKKETNTENTRFLYCNHWYDIHICLTNRSIINYSNIMWCCLRICITCIKIRLLIIVFTQNVMVEWITDLYKKNNTQVTVIIS